MGIPIIQQVRVGAYIMKQKLLGRDQTPEVDIQGFVIRFDLASPLKRPSKSWKFEYDSPKLNFAIGYPF